MSGRLARQAVDTTLELNKLPGVDAEQIQPVLNFWYRLSDCARTQLLRTALQQMRDAIDHYHGIAMRGKIMVAVGSEGYPMDLETLVKGAVDAHGQTVHFLPKIPGDPMTGATDWGVRHVRPQGGIHTTFTQPQRVRLWMAPSTKTGKPSSIFPNLNKHLLKANRRFDLLAGVLRRDLSPVTCLHEH